MYIFDQYFELQFWYTKLYIVRPDRMLVKNGVIKKNDLVFVWEDTESTWYNSPVVIFCG